MVTSRKGRVSRNGSECTDSFVANRHVPQGACE